MKIHLIALISATLLLACGVPKGAEEDTNLNQHLNEFSGQYEELEFGRVSYKASAEEGELILTELDVNGKKFTVTVDPDTGMQEIDGYGAILSYEDKNALIEAQSLMESEIDSANYTEEQQAMIAVTSYIASSPEGYVHEKRRFNSSTSLRGDGLPSF